MSLGMRICDENQSELDRLFHNTYSNKMSWVPVDEKSFKGSDSFSDRFLIYKDSEGITLRISFDHPTPDWIIDSEPNGMYYEDLHLLWDTIKSQQCKVYYSREGLKTYFLKWYEESSDDWCNDLRRQIDLYNRCTKCTFGKNGKCRLKK